MARVPAFQAGCCEFESRLPLHKTPDNNVGRFINLLYGIRSYLCLIKIF